MGLAFLSGANPFLFFLERKESKRKSSADHAFALFKAVYAILLHKTDGSYVNRLLFFLEEKKQKKINCGASILRCCCCFRQRAAQNGRFVCEPSVFRFKQDERESCSSQTNDLPRNVFCFFSSRKEIVPLYLGKKEIVPLKKEKIVPPRSQAQSSTSVSTQTPSEAATAFPRAWSFGIRIRTRNAAAISSIAPA